jgi:hypothetical protein
MTPIFEGSTRQAGGDEREDNINQVITFNEQRPFGEV